jgi:septum formation protein
MIKIQELLKIDKPLILASKSPRRKKLLKQLGFEFAVVPSDVDENNLSTEISPPEYAKELAYSKAKDIAEKTKEPAIIIGSDTIVVLDDKILNKPENSEDAARMLRTLSGRTHIVYTGISLVESVSLRNHTDVQRTEVTFRALTDDEISAYVVSGSPLDKAGAYGIQDDFGAVFVSHINGCYYNIVGLPLEMLYNSLKNFVEK